MGRLRTKNDDARAPPPKKRSNMTVKQNKNVHAPEEYERKIGRNIQNRSCPESTGESGKEKT